MKPAPEPWQVASLRGARTQEVMAAFVGVTTRMWRQWESGLKPMPARVWARICDARPVTQPQPVNQPPTLTQVKALRLSYSCNRYQIAQFVGVQPATWGRWERTCPPTLNKWLRVLKALEGQAVTQTKPLESDMYADPARIVLLREAAMATRAQAAALIDAKERTWKAWELGQRPMKQSKLDEWVVKATAWGNARMSEAGPAAYHAPEMPAPRPIYFRPQGDVHVTVPGAIVITDDMTAEQEAEMEKDLMTPVMYDPRNPKSVQDALMAELGDQDALRKAAYERTMELVARDQKRLEED